ncbi:MAG: type I phosphomannose isomerase catalytic subunit [Flavobacteriaceae bacterium]
MQSYPLLFDPILKERIWGGERLRYLLGRNSSSNRIGESWEISGVKGDVSSVINGLYQKRLLTDLIDEFDRDFLGDSVIERFGKAFPILIKFLDARLDLSIQVHPSDQLAQKRHNSFGKNEMWYILEAEKEAKLIIGFKEDVDRERYTDYLHRNRLTDLLAYHPVAKADAFFIETGTIHAIGAGIVLAEIQQTSDVTYRVYDFNRKDSEGNTRELHTDLALDALNFKAKSTYKLQSEVLEEHSLNAHSLARTPYFKTNEISLFSNEVIDLESLDSFVIYIVVEGSAIIYDLAMPEIRVEAALGTTLLLPACCKKIAIETFSCRLLEVFV